MDKNIFIIGVFGTTSSGKSFFSNLLKNELKNNLDFNDVIHIDVDKLGHVALQEKKDDVVSKFGDFILNSEGSIDRGKLGSIVFNDKEKLDILNSIVHKNIQEKIKNTISNSPKKFCYIIDAALLFELNLQVFCNIIYYINTPYFIKLLFSIKKNKKKLSFFKSISKTTSILRLQKNIKIEFYNHLYNLSIKKINNWSGNLKTKVLTEVYRIRHERE